MHKSLFKLTVVAFIVFFVAAMPARAGVVANEKGKLGYMDASGQLTIGYQYDFIGDFNEKGIALVKKGKKFGFVNEQGTVVLPLKYTEIGRFENGYAWIKKGEKMGYINDEGKMLFDAKFVHIWPFNSKGIAKAVVKKNKKADLKNSYNTFAVLNNEGKQIAKGYGQQLLFFQANSSLAKLTELDSDTINMQCDYFVFYNNKSGASAAYNYYDVHGNIVLDDKIRENIYKEVFNSSYKKRLTNASQIEWMIPLEDIAPLKYNLKLTDKSARVAAIYYDLKQQKILAKWLYDEKYGWSEELHKNAFIPTDGKGYYLEPFHDGFGLVSNQLVINKEGKQVAKYSQAFSYRNGYMVVKAGSGRYGIVDTNQQYQINPQYFDCSTFVMDNGYWMVKDKQNHWGVVNTENKLIVPLQYDNLQLYARNNLTLVNKGTKWGAFVADDQVLNCEYDSINHYYDNAFIVAKNNKLAVYSLSRRRTSITFDNYEGAYISNELHDNVIFGVYNITKAQSSNEQDTNDYGFIDGFGDVVIPFVFSDPEHAYQAYMLYRYEPTRTFSDLDLYRMLLRFTRRDRTYKLDSIVPEEDWDY